MKFFHKVELCEARFGEMLAIPLILVRVAQKLQPELGFLQCILFSDILTLLKRMLKKNNHYQLAVGDT